VTTNLSRTSVSPSRKNYRQLKNSWALHRDPRNAARAQKAKKTVRVHDRSPSVKVNTKPKDLFSHLKHKDKKLQVHKTGFGQQSEVHHSFLRIGLKMAEGTLVGGNARTMALMRAFQSFINDFKPDKKILYTRDLLRSINSQIRFFIDCRTLNTAMENAIRWLKGMIGRSDAEAIENDDDAMKELLIEKIEEYIRFRIMYAVDVIAEQAGAEIKKEDVVMVFGRSTSVERALISAEKRIKLENEEKKKGEPAHWLDYKADETFKVIIVDTRPNLEGKLLLERLLEADINCSYTLLNGLTYVLKNVTKVLLGASGVLTNGQILGRAGSAMISLNAFTRNIPIIVCCETHKFTSRVQLDAICFNELGDPDELINTGYNRKRYLSDWRDHSNLRLLNLTYDLTPGDFISMIISEEGTFSPYSVAMVQNQFDENEMNFKDS